MVCEKSVFALEFLAKYGALRRALHSLSGTTCTVNAIVYKLTSHDKARLLHSINRSGPPLWNIVQRPQLLTFARKQSRAT